MKNSTKNWSADQSILDQIFLKYVNKINIYVLPKTFLDFYCSKNTNIHFCKGKEFNWKRSKWQNIIYKTNKKFKIKFNI